MAALLAGVDRAGFAVGFGVRLRRAGVAVGFVGIEAFTRALAACPPDSLAELYWLGRITLVHRFEELPIYDEVFQAVFSRFTSSLDPIARRPSGLGQTREDDAYASLAARGGSEEVGQGLPWASLPAPVDTRESEDEGAVFLPERRASHLEAIADLPFESLSAAHLDLLDETLATALGSWPTRRSRRVNRHHAGHRVALRPTLARARRSGFEPVALVRTRPLEKPRRVVIVCDVSQSMQQQAAAYFHLMRALARATEAEVFVFATRLTRLTHVLAGASAELAMEMATAKVTDRFGGTRIATNLQALLSSSRGDALRGAIVLIASDGWDSDPPDDLAMVMAKIRRRAHRLIWVNPRAAAPGFAPKVAAMAAALPFCDDLLPANSIRQLTELVATIGRSG